MELSGGRPPGQGSDRGGRAQGPVRRRSQINWAERLERIGAQVVYGVVGHKTHAKLLPCCAARVGSCAATCTLSTGNYNPKTARLYTDLARCSPPTPN